MIANRHDSIAIRFSGHANHPFASSIPCSVFGKWFLTILGATLVALLSACCAGQTTIRDIQRLPQDAAFYLPPERAELPALDAASQQPLDERYNQVLLAPWYRRQPAYGKEVLCQRLERFSGNLGYGENKQPHSGRWMDQLEQEVALATFPNAGFAAITSAATDLRELPTAKPHFNAFDLPGEGYPFDNLQYSAIPANTPVFVSHVSADRSWMLVESHYGLGWMKSADVALVDDAFIGSWTGGGYVAIIKDDWPLYDDMGHFLFKVSVGQIFPVVAETADGFQVLAAVADEWRRARIRKATLPRHAAASKPMSLTPANIGRIANELMNQTYGWGGLYGNRDCSATLKDLFAPFGLWLPRNSAQQAHHAGTFIRLDYLSRAAKKQTIMTQGVPCLTLLWGPGHIALYVGSHEGEPMIFHNLWGIRIRDWQGREGRKVVGHAAITTLHPGAELSNVHGDLLNRIEGMTLLVSPE
jgi:hypothetical protein